MLTYIFDFLSSAFKVYRMSYVLRLNKSKAFDIAQHTSLIFKLPSIWFPPPHSLTISRFLSDRFTSAIKALLHLQIYTFHQQFTQLYYYSVYSYAYYSTLSPFFQTLNLEFSFQLPDSILAKMDEISR